MTNVASAIVSLVAVFNSEDEVLLLKRKADVHCPDVWSFPGGKAKANEMPLQAAIRELGEETGIKGRLWRHVGKHMHHYPDRTISFVLFFCRYDGAVHPEHMESDIRWCRLNQLQAVKMPEANVVLIQMLTECQQEGLFPV